jgi:hypothetical protein
VREVHLDCGFADRQRDGELLVSHARRGMAEDLPLSIAEAACEGPMGRRRLGAVGKAR